jgi:hypothetical protein
VAHRGGTWRPGQIVRLLGSMNIFQSSACNCSLAEHSAAPDVAVVGRPMSDR